MTKRLLAMALALCMLLAMVPAVSAANVVVLDLSKDDYRLSVTGYWPGDAEEEIPFTGSYRIIQSDPAATANYLLIASGEQKVTICGLNYEDDHPAIEIYAGASLDLTLDGASTLKAREKGAIELYADQNEDGLKSSALRISGSGSLSAWGGGYAPAIGVWKNRGPVVNSLIPAQNDAEAYVTVTGDAVLELHGGEDAPAIGTPRDVFGRMDISITDGADVTAFGGIGDYLDTLTLDDTVRLWSQVPFGSVIEPIPVEMTTYSSASTYLYVCRNRFRPLALTEPEDKDWAQQHLIYPQGTDCLWTLENGTLCIDGMPKKSGVALLDGEKRLGGWALLQGSKQTAPVVIPSEPEQGGRLFWIPDEFPFVDVTYSDWCYESVHAAWQNGLIDGVTWNLFKPNASLTVAQAVKLSAALHQMQKQEAVSLTNGAVHWYDTYVSYAVSNGLIEAEYQTRTAAQMNAPVTRGEFVHILFGALLDSRGMNAVADDAIPDVKMSDSFAAEIYTFYRAGILTGSDDAGTFHPASTIKRSEAAAILTRIYSPSARMGITLP